jgi:acetylornithine deacetylase/succinyl-diaminopimelate desuccinylase-like protein
LEGCKVNALYDEGRSPFLIVQIEASEGNTSQNSVLYYGHMDKQPFGPGWKYPATEPIIEDGKLYGRGSSDDCYALYAAVLSVKACQTLGLPHPKIVITIEGSEEGGNTEDLVHYLSTYRDLIGSPNTVLCLDTSALLEDTLAISTSLRGGCNFDLTVGVSKDNMHSGYSGIVPDPYLIAVSLLERIHDFKTHEVIKDFEVEVPSYRIEETKFAASRLPLLSTMLPTVPGLSSRAAGHAGGLELEKYQIILNSTWKP